MSDYAIGPGALDTGGGAFLLSRPEWISVQQYVEASLRLPTDKETLRQGLPAEPPGGMDQFDDLLAAYKGMHDHCQHWRDHSLPDSVSCAADVVHYNDKVPSYYGALRKLLPELEQKSPAKAAVEQFKAILANLSGQAKVYASHAELVRQEMMTFADQSAEDHATIMPLKEAYEKQLGAESPEIERLTKQLDDDKAELAKWEKEYHDDVVKAATTPTYAWIAPFGTVAAAIVAGVYGKKATDAKSKADGYRKAISGFQDELQAATTLLMDLTSIYNDMVNISGQLKTALPVIQKIQGVWTAIHSDLDNILRIIEEDIGQAQAIIKSLGIEEAIGSWARVAHEADVYRHTAYITVTTEDEAKKAGLELHRMLKAA